MAEKKLADIDLAALVKGRAFFPSPVAWEDQVLYFMMLDRFSNNKEKNYMDNNGKIVTSGSTPLFQPGDQGNAIKTEAAAKAWQDAGATWIGGTLKGLTSKLGYLQRLGITAIWVSPIFKQVSFETSYHGYGIQNFLEVDPHFGTRDNLKTMVKTAHELGIYVVLDIILNHAGNVFGYSPDRYWTVNEKGESYLDARWDGTRYQVKGFHDADGRPGIPFSAPVPASAWPDSAIWPAEFQDPACYTQKGRIQNWDYDPEFLDGDFCSLKDIHLGSGHLDHYQPSSALFALAEVYKFWIAFADIDGFRVDTVKHMDPGATRFFTSVIHEFSQSIGKDNFYLIGEITGDRKRAVNTLEETGLDAALGIADIPDKMEYLVKGYRDPSEYFDLFRNSLLVNKDSHVWFKNKVVTVLDDHDQVRKGENKARFCADDIGKKQVLNALALNVMTLGIPCLYYGSEQGFDGQGNNDRYIREAMFGSTFGAFRTQDRHFFNEENPLYKELSKILSLRKRSIVLRRGRQYLREISGDGVNFGLPRMMGSEIRSVIPWSRLFDDQEMLLAINTDSETPRTAWVIVDNKLNKQNDTFTCSYSQDQAQLGQKLVVKELQPGMLAVQLTVPAAGFVIFE